jgi:hypothetical protein
LKFHTEVSARSFIAVFGEYFMLFTVELRWSGEEEQARGEKKLDESLDENRSQRFV